MEQSVKKRTVIDWAVMEALGKALKDQAIAVTVEQLQGLLAGLF
ncbi:hypothetical protein O77CONTIG1_02769 [Leptolyngbya sp. O-77]|nr:hypothetical protein O77CONTIG1_02769 [Leptolyngbya sp. O-77]